MYDSAMGSNPFQNPECVRERCSGVAHGSASASTGIGAVRRKQLDHLDPAPPASPSRQRSEVQLASNSSERDQDKRPHFTVVIHTFDGDSEELYTNLPPPITRPVLSRINACVIL